MAGLTDRIDELTRTVVNQSLDEIQGCLDIRVRRMSVAEARGYVRARARRIIIKRTALVAADSCRLSTAAMQTVVTKALERATHQVVRGILTVPQTQFGLRIAG